MHRRPILIRFVLAALALSALTGAAVAQTQQPQPPPQSRNDAVVVPAPEYQRPQNRAPDPRTIEQQRRDRRSFERCLLRAQARETEERHYNPLRPDAAEVCRQRTRMWDENTAPQPR